MLRKYKKYVGQRLCLQVDLFVETAISFLTCYGFVTRKHRMNVEEGAKSSTVQLRLEEERDLKR